MPVTLKTKAHELTDAKISFVSLVDKAANKRRFLITKAHGDGRSDFQSYGRIIKADPDNHFVTGIVYEPMTEDSQGDFMTEAEITKAAYWFAKNGNQIDVQHNFKALKNASVVESWVAKADFTVNNEEVKKGTWLMTAEIQDNKIWSAIEKGEITGFSMGGIGSSAEEDVDLASVSKGSEAKEETFFQKLAKKLGVKLTKNLYADAYDKRSKDTAFWEAIDTLRNCLHPYNNITDSYEFVHDEALIKATLEEFAAVICGILLDGADASGSMAIAGAEINKAGRKMSGKNKETLQEIYNSLGVFLKEFEDPEDVADDKDDDKKDDESGDCGSGESGSNAEEDDKEDKKVTKSEFDASLEKAITKALAARGIAAGENAEVEKADKPTDEIKNLTAEKLNEIVEKAVEKALSAKNQNDADASAEVNALIDEKVQKAVDGLLSAKGLPSNFNSDAGSVAKSDNKEPHYLAGIL